MNISNEEVVEMYGDRHDGIYVYKGNKNVGFITDLRTKMFRESKNKKVKVARKDLHAKEAKEAALILFADLKSAIDEEDADVFINITQPNIKHEDFVIYCMAGLSENHRVSVTHKNLDFEQMAILLEGFFPKETLHNRSILFNSLSKEDILEIFNILKRN